MERLIIWVVSKSCFWRVRTLFRRIGFIVERSMYKTGASIGSSKENVRISGSIAWIGVKSLFWVVLCLTMLNVLEKYIRTNLPWVPLYSVSSKEYVEQLKLYAQLLTAIFSIYFATIGIILSAGYTRLRSDIIQMLTNEQVGSIYSKALVLAAMFCLVATTLPLFSFDLGLFIYSVGTLLTLLSALALFPLGQRLFNFFDLNLLVRSEILPKIARHIEAAANPRTSVSLANHHSKAARNALDQLSYIDDRVKVGRERLQDNLPSLTDGYMALLLHYLKRKHTIDQSSYWFPRRIKHKQWFLAGDSATTMALKTSSQQLLIEEKLDHQWLESEIVNRLAGHVELAFIVGDLSLALKLLSKFSSRISGYARQFQFDVGMREVRKFKEIIERAFAALDGAADDEAAKIRIGIADTWAALGSSLCMETLRRIITFEQELKRFFERDEWSEKSLRRLPAFMQVELALIVVRLDFEHDIEGERLSKPKYLQQLAVQKLSQHYTKILPDICSFYQVLIPGFVDSLTKCKMPEAATQVVLASLNSHKMLPRWLDELGQLMARYLEYEHYKEKSYNISKINIDEITKALATAKDDAIARLGRGDMVGHIFESYSSDELPDHFGQIYFELAEACINALENNDVNRLDKVLPMFMSLALLASDSKFMDPMLDVNNEFRLHLVSAVINDLSSVLGFSIIYGAYFGNKNLYESALAQFEVLIGLATDRRQYLKRMIVLSDSFSFSMSASPRSIIRINWKISFENRVREDGFGDYMGRRRGKLHPDKIVREFLKSNADASHLFFAKLVIPQIEPVDFDVNYEISSLARRLREDNGEAKHEDF